MLDFENQIGIVSAPAIRQMEELEQRPGGVTKP